MASAEAEIFRHDFPQTDRDSWTRRPEAALRRRFEIRGSFWFHPDKTVRVARDAHTSLNSESSSADGARDGGPRRDRGWSRERRSFDGPFGASRETRAKRAERRRKTKRNFAFCDLFQIRSWRRARRRGKRERFSLLVRRRSDSRFPTRGGVPSDGYSKRRKGRSVLDPTTKTRRRAENFQALQKCDSVARASFRAFSVCSGYPASFFGPWLCACVWHESMLLSCVWRASRDRRVG